MSALTLLLMLSAEGHADAEFRLEWSRDPLPRTVAVLGDPDMVGAKQELGFSTAIVPDSDGDGQAEVAIGAANSARIIDDTHGSFRLIPADTLRALVGTTVTDAIAARLLGNDYIQPLGTSVVALPDPTAWPRAAYAVGAREYGTGGDGGLLLLHPDAVAWDDLDEAWGWHGDQTLVLTTETSGYFGNTVVPCPVGPSGEQGLLIGAARAPFDTCNASPSAEVQDGAVHLVPTPWIDPTATGEADACLWPGSATLLGIDSGTTGAANDRLGASVACGGAGEVTGAWALAGNNINCPDDDCPDGRDAYAVQFPADPSSLSYGIARDTASAVWFIPLSRLSYSEFIVVGPGADLDHDGYDDIIIGIPGYDNTAVCPAGLETSHSVTGAVAVYYTDPAAPFSGETELGPDTADLFICGASGSRTFGRVITAGDDMNGDGVDDLVVADVRTDTTRHQQLRAFYGRTERLTGTWDMDELEAWSVQVVDDAEGSEAVRGAQFGFSLSLGHVDADGLADLVIGAPELPGTDSATGRGGVWLIYGAPDRDGDGFLPATSGGTDCSDASAEVYQGAPDTLGDGVDQDCSGFDGPGTDCLSATDCDGDGFGAADGDCDDTNAWVAPGATELRDAIDNDCDGDIDEGTTAEDADGDGFSVDEGDCDDTRSDVNPDGDEGGTADGVNQDCDHRTDELTIGYDDDGDGVLDPEDCDDLDPDVRPGVEDVCNGVDDDCDGDTDEDAYAEGFLDEDGDGYGSSEAPFAGCPAPATLVDNEEDCDDTRAEVRPGQLDTCDGVDDDCDDDVDEDGWEKGYLDQDGDGFGDAEAPWDACPPEDARVVANDLDCDDGRADIYPGADAGPSEEDRDCNTWPDQARLLGCSTGVSTTGGGGPLVFGLVGLGLALRRRRAIPPSAEVEPRPC